MIYQRLLGGEEMSLFSIVSFNAKDKLPSFPRFVWKEQHIYFTIFVFSNNVNRILDV